MSKSNYSKESIYQKVTQKIIDALEDGVGPWVRPWSVPIPQGGHRNALSKRPYRGINVLLLNLFSLERGFGFPLWVTFRNALKMGGHVRKGEKGVQIVFWNFKEVERATKDSDEDGEPKKKTVAFCRSYTVFNIDQCEGIKLEEVEDKVSNQPAIRPSDLAEKILSLAEIRYGGFRSYYDRQPDVVILPDKGRFKSRDGFYSTALHEMTHWTGHESRLNRKFGRRFGDQAYAFEELVAEMGSAFLETHIGLPVEKLQHPEYIKGWVEVLGKDNKAIFTAAREAQKACDYLINAAGVFQQAELKKAA